MKFLIVYSSRQDGHDPLGPVLAKELQTANHDVTLHNAEAGLPETSAILAQPWDVILLLNAAHWHLANRMKYKGRPWLCTASFCFDDLRPVLELNAVSDMGSNFFISNYPSFIKQVSAVLPAFFMFKPVIEIAPTERTNAIGCVLPSIVDRDLCLLERTRQVLTKVDKVGLLKIYTRIDDNMRLPESLRPYEMKFRQGQEEAVYQSLNGYVLAPRITDYRAGSVPSELIRACSWGCLPLVVYHPALASISGVIDPMFTSLRAFDAALLEMADNKDSVQIRLSRDLCPRPSELISAVLSAYSRKTNAA